jgi:hypothetical protein
MTRRPEKANAGVWSVGMAVPRNRWRSVLMLGHRKKNADALTRVGIGYCLWKFETDQRQRGSSGARS